MCIKCQMAVTVAASIIIPVSYSHTGIVYLGLFLFGISLSSPAIVQHLWHPVSMKELQNWRELVGHSPSQGSVRSLIGCSRWSTSTCTPTAGWRGRDMRTWARTDLEMSFHVSESSTCTASFDSHPITHTRTYIHTLTCTKRFWSP